MTDKDKELEYWENRLVASEPDILPENYKYLKRHIKKLWDADRKAKTVKNHIVCLLKFSIFIKKPYSELIEEDLEDFFDTLGKIKPSTVALYKIIIKTLLNETNAALAQLVKVKRIFTEITPDELLTDDEIDKLIEFASSPRDKALIACLADSGARKGELLSVTIADVKFDNHGAIIWLRKSKTKPRPSRLVFASSYLRVWLECHPRKDDQTALVFCGSRPPYNGMSRGCLYNMIGRLGERAKIGKRINPHKFRHTRATDLAKKVKSEQKLKAIMGWEPSSPMAARYVHLSGADIDDALLEANGIKKEESEMPAPRTSPCPRCKEPVPRNEKRCLKCGFSVEDNTEREEIKSDIDELREIVKQQQKMLDENSKAAVLNLEILRTAGTSFESIKDRGLIEKIRKAVKDREEGDKNG